MLTLRSGPAVASTVLAFLTLTGCGAAPTAEIADRVWISALPTGPRDAFSALVLTERAGKGVGFLFSGSMYRGGHDLVAWKRQGAGRYELELLQTRSKFDVRSEPCTPSPGFDYCMRLVGDPSGHVRYQSRKRWTLRRKPKDVAQAQELLDETLREDAITSTWLEENR